MRLRTACELEIDESQGITVKRPSGGALPADADLTARLAELIVACRPHFASPTTTMLTWNRSAGKTT